MAIETTTAKLTTGQLIPNFRLSAVNRDGQVGPWDYKQHRNLVLIFFRSAECRKCQQLFREIAEHYGDYQQKEAEVLAISTDELDHLRQLAQDFALPFPVLSDSDGQVTNLYLKHPEQIADKFDVAIFVADRWGAVFSTKRIEIDHDLPVEAEVRHHGDGDLIDDLDPVQHLREHGVLVVEARVVDEIDKDLRVAGVAAFPPSRLESSLK